MQKTLLVLLFIFSGMVMNAQDSLTEYTGKYIFPEGSVVTEINVSIENGGLISNSSQGTATLSRAGVDSFLVVEYNGTAVFKRNEEKKVNGVHIEVMDFILDGKKEESGSWSFSVLYLPSRELQLTKRYSEPEIN